MFGSIFNSQLSKIIKAILLLVVLNACEKSIDYQLKNQQPEVVVYAFPMPDSTLKIHGSKTTNILALHDYEPIENTTISVLVNDKMVLETIYPSNQEWFTIEDIVGEELSNIKVTFEGTDGKIISANSTIPNEIPIESIDTASVVIQNDDNEDENMLRCYIELNDPPNETNYYQIRVDSKKWFKNNSDTSLITETIEYIKEDKVFVIRDDESVLLNDVDFQGTFNDFLFDGSNYVVKILIPEKYLVIENSGIKNILEIQLYSLTSEYYQFIRSSISEEAYREYPFFERVNIYSNVENGLGVVAGLSLNLDSVTIFDSDFEPF